jgi:putative DNA primase/helicase
MAWSRIKELTGNERPISARFMRMDFFEFVVLFKLVFATNHMPRFPTTDKATARRPNLLPFRFTAREPDKTLKTALIQEHGPILRWAIDGCLDWQANGLLRPDCVVQLTRDCLDAQDLLAHWITAKCTTGPYESGTHQSLFADWSKFSSANGEASGSGHDFHERMVSAGFRATKHTPRYHNYRGYLGISVKQS